MSLPLLKRLADLQLPAVVDEATDLDHLEVLVLAGHARANIPEPIRTLEGYLRPPATVLEITRLGKQAMAMF